MHKCFRCSKTIDRSIQSICFYQKNHFHEECCKICKLTKPIKDKTPPPAQSLKFDPKKGKADPRKLSFNKIGTFEKNSDVVICIDCKNKICGERFLTQKLGELRCQDCNTLMIDKCFMCKVTFDQTKEIFKDDSENKYCTKCIKIYKEEKLRRELAEEQAKHVPPIKSLKNTIHCDKCTKELKSEIVDYEGENFHLQCFVCTLCSISLKSVAVVHTEKGLICENCKKAVKCKI